MGSGRNLSGLNRIAVLRALGGLGDFLCMVPALRSLRLTCPNAGIFLVGLPHTRALATRFSRYLDGLLEFPGYPGLPEQVPQLQQVPTFFTHAQNYQFDLAIQMHGSGILTNSLTVMLGAQQNAGFFLPDHYCPDPPHFLPYLSHESEVRRYLRLLEFLGMSSQGEQLEFPLNADDEAALSNIAAAHDLDSGAYVCIHPGASVVERRWPPEYFVVVADNLAKRGLKVVLTGTTEELPLTRSIAQAMQAESINLAGCTSLGALAVLLKKTRLLVCNDTGVSHLADALQVPSVVIFREFDIDRWAPLNRQLHRVVASERGILPIDVMHQVETLLAQPIVPMAPDPSTPSLEVGEGL